MSDFIEITGGSGEYFEIAPVVCPETKGLLLRALTPTFVNSYEIELTGMSLVEQDPIVGITAVAMPLGALTLTVQTPTVG